MSDWQLDLRQERALRHRIRHLGKLDRRMAEGTMVFKTKAPEVWELEIKDNVQLRPMVCFGPKLPDSEVTFLARAVKRDNALVPKYVHSDAMENLADLRRDIDGKRRQIWPASETS